LQIKIKYQFDPSYYRGKKIQVNVENSLLKNQNSASINPTCSQKNDLGSICEGEVEIEKSSLLVELRIQISQMCNLDPSNTRLYKGDKFKFFLFFFCFILFFLNFFFCRKSNYRKLLYNEKKSLLMNSISGFCFIFIFF
jgi:hypothetical protein